MDAIEPTETHDPSFGTLIAKKFAMSTAQSAGVYVALFAVFASITKAIQFKEARDAKKYQTQE